MMKNSPSFLKYLAEVSRLIALDSLLSRASKSIGLVTIAEKPFWCGLLLQVCLALHRQTEDRDGFCLRSSECGTMKAASSEEAYHDCVRLIPLTVIDCFPVEATPDTFQLPPLRPVEIDR